MVELVPIAGMLFSLLLVLIIGGFVLLYPLSKRLGQLLELRLEERRARPPGAVAAAEVQQLSELVSALQVEVAALVERQEFTERLLESGDHRSAAAPTGSAGKVGTEEAG